MYLIYCDQSQEYTAGAESLLEVWCNKEYTNMVLKIIE